MNRPWLLAGLLSLACLTAAEAAELRRLTLANGLSIDVEVAATEAEGLRVTSMQGTFLVPYEELADMVPVATLAAEAERTWRVVVGADAASTPYVSAALATIPGLRVLTAEDGLPSDSAAAIDLCALDAACIAAAVPGEGWRFSLVVERPGEAGPGAVIGRLAADTSDVRIPLESFTPELLRAAIQAALGLIPDAAPEALTLTFDTLNTAEEKAARRAGRGGGAPASQARVVALSFVPIPGFPSLMQKDYGSFGIALATSVAASTGWVLGTGHTATSRGEHALMSVAGAYAFTVAANQALGFRSLNRSKVALSVAPSIDRRGIGGASVQVFVVPRGRARR